MEPRFRRRRLRLVRRRWLVVGERVVRRSRPPARPRFRGQLLEVLARPLLELIRRRQPPCVMQR